MLTANIGNRAIFEAMLSSSSDRIVKWLPWVFLALVAYVPIFHQLGTESIKTFDESLFALRAYRLAETGQYLNNFKEFPDGPSATNLKTPLFTGVQAFSFKIFGYTEFALRLPVALMVLLIGWLMIRATSYITDSTYGWTSVMVLLASFGLFHVHAARSGDHDVPLSFFLLLSAWGIYRYLEASDRKWIWMAGLATWAAMMTKGVAGAFWVPGLILYITWRKGWKSLLTDRNTWIVLSTVLTALIAYYAYREWDYPGFLEQLWKGELGGHYLKVHDGHNWPLLWYVERLITIRYSAWVWWLPVSWVAMWLPVMKPLRNWLILMNLVMLSQLAVISGSSTKLEWYDVPMYAPMAMIIGALFWAIWEGFIQTTTRSQWLRTGLVAGLVLAIWLPAYLPVFNKNVEPTYIDYPGERFAGLMKQVKRLYPDQKRYKIVYSSFSTHCLYYRLVYNEQLGYEIERAHGPEHLMVGDFVMTCEESMWEDLQKYYIIEPKTSKDRCFYAQIVGRL